VQPSCNRGADALGRAGDQDALADQFHRHDLKILPESRNIPRTATY
jgi:hypothetical protein